MQNKYAFTLIELLVVVLIIGILAALALPQYQKAVLKSHLAEGLAQLRALALAEQTYYLANGTYADSFDKLDMDFNINTPNWHLDLSRIGAPAVYATHINPRFYLDYDLNTHKIFCFSHEDAGENMCKTVGSLQNCPSWLQVSANCYFYN